MRVDRGTLGRRFARLVTTAVVGRPALWALFRGPLRQQFEGLAPTWDSRRTPGGLAPLDAALEAVSPPPARVLDLGTGTGAAALAIAARWPQAEVIGVDLAAAMVEEARRKTPPALAARVRFEQGDAARLAHADGTFDLVVLANMIPFFDELARVVAPGGAAVFSSSLGAATPIAVPQERLRAELGRRGFAQFATFSAGSGTALLARKVTSA